MSTNPQDVISTEKVVLHHFASVRLVGWWLTCPPTHPDYTMRLFFFCVTFYCADFLVGFVHMTGDFFHMPQFTEHHATPHYMTTRGYVHHTFRAYLGSVIFLYFFGLAQSNFAVTLLLLAVQGNEIHAWLHIHDREPQWLLSWLQSKGILITREAHARHHAPPYNHQFCTLSGWANPLLNVLSVPLYTAADPFRQWLAASPTYMHAVNYLRT